MVRQQAEAEELLTLLVSVAKAANKTGYFGVYHINAGQPKPYQARVRRGGKQVSLGYFATAEEAALCVARTPEGRALQKRPAAVAPLTSEEARQQAQAEGLTLLVAKNRAGYFGVHHKPGQSNSKPYQAVVRRGGKQVYLGSFAAAEEAALCVARSPEGQEVAKQAVAMGKVAAKRQLTSEEEAPRRVVTKVQKCQAVDLPGDPTSLFVQVNPGPDRNHSPNPDPDTLNLTPKPNHSLTLILTLTLTLTLGQPSEISSLLNMPARVEVPEDDVTAWLQTAIPCAYGFTC